VPSGRSLGSGARREPPRNGHDPDHGDGGLAAPVHRAGGRQPLLPAARRSAPAPDDGSDHRAGIARPGRTAGADRRQRLHHILTSAIGSDITPVTTTFDLQWDDVLLLCTDGLTKHLTDEDIRQVLTTSLSARGACRRLAGQAVKRGGSDNVTVVVGRLK